MQETSHGAPVAEDSALTRALAHFVLATTFDDLPETVRHEGARSLLNWVGCAIGGAPHETVTNAITALSPFFGPAQATLCGRAARADILHAALINGISSHVLDFDDTHIETAIHPTAPVAPAILALAERSPLSGRDLLTALVVGIETEFRIGIAATPAHYKLGWHITGTTGVFGSAAAAGKLLGLNEQQMCWALGLAAAQPVGLQAMFGSMTKSFHPGRAAQNGLTAALLAASGYTASERALEAKSGWLKAMSPASGNAAAITAPGCWRSSTTATSRSRAALWCILLIDGCIRLRNAHNLKPEMIERIEVVVHPKVMDVTAIREPKTGLEGKFSVYHAAAVAVVEGAAGEQQFSDQVVCSGPVAALRARVAASIDPAVGKAQARVKVTCRDGRTQEVFVEHAVGSVENPMSDRALEDKFHGLTQGIIEPGPTARLIDLCWNVERLADAGEIARATASG